MHIWTPPRDALRSCATFWLKINENIYNWMSQRSDCPWEIFWRESPRVFEISTCDSRNTAGLTGTSLHHDAHDHCESFWQKIRQKEPKGNILEPRLSQKINVEPHWNWFYIEPIANHVLRANMHIWTPPHDALRSCATFWLNINEKYL